MHLLQDEEGVAMADVYVEIYVDEHCKRCGGNPSNALGHALGLMIVSQRAKDDKWILACPNCGLHGRDIGLKDLLDIIPQLQACAKEFKSETRRLAKSTVLDAR